MADYPDVPIKLPRVSKILSAISRPISLRNLERATELATRATELAGDDAASWHTLGMFITLRANGMKPLALEKSLEIQPESGSARFLLSMTQWQLGDLVAAQRSYVQAEKDGPDKKGLRRLRRSRGAIGY